MRILLSAFVEDRERTHTEWLVEQECCSDPIYAVCSAMPFSRPNT